MSTVYDAVIIAPSPYAVDISPNACIVSKLAVPAVPLQVHAALHQHHLATANVHLLERLFPNFIVFPPFFIFMINNSYNQQELSISLLLVIQQISITIVFL